MDKDVTDAMAQIIFQLCAETEATETIEKSMMMTGKVRYIWRKSKRSRDNSRSSSYDSSRSSSRGRPPRNLQHSNRYRRRPTPHHIDTITINKELIGNSDTHSEGKPTSKCKNRVPTPLPEKLFNFSDTRSTCDELSLTDTDSVTSYTHTPAR